LNKILRRVIPGNFKRSLLRLGLPNNSVTAKYMWRLLFDKGIPLTFAERWSILRRFTVIDRGMVTAHSKDELLVPAFLILSMEGGGAIIEAGAYKGAGTAKFSIIGRLSNRRLYVFDSFEGLPENDEPLAYTTMGYDKEFRGGEYSGTLDEVKSNVARFGEPDVCRYVKGFFSDSMPGFTEEVVAISCDIDLLMSYKDILTHMWSNLKSGGYLFSQDLHIPLVAEALENPTFWKEHLSIDEAPKLVRFTKRFGVFIKP